MATFVSHVPLVKELTDEAAEKGLTLALEYLLTEANKTVPHDEGTLERSGATDRDGLTGCVSYDTPYAARQHEDMALHHDGKGRAKWLEETMGEERDTMGQIVSTTMRKAVGT